MLPILGKRARLSVLPLLLAALFSGCFKHPKTDITTTTCETADNCPKGYICALPGKVGGCQLPPDAGVGADVGPRPDGATDGDGGWPADSVPESRPDTAEVRGAETGDIVDLGPAVNDDSGVLDGPGSVDLGPLGIDSGRVTDAPALADLSPISLDSANIADGPGIADTAPLTADVSADSSDGPLVAADLALPSVDTLPDTQVQVDAPPVVSDPVTLSVSVAGSGTGKVTSTIAGISCPGDCSETYPPGTSVELTATQDPGSVFAGWTGGGCGASATCTVTMDANTGVIATFNPLPYKLTVTTSGTGSVVSDPDGINCGATCAYDFNPGTNVRLTASGSSTSVFTGWSGDCSGTADTCTVTMSAAHAVTASFRTVTPLTCTSVSTAESCAGGSVPDINLGSGLDAQVCHDRCQVELAADSASTGCWIVGANGECLCRNGALTSLNGSLHTGGGCTGSVGSITCDSVTNALACTAGAAEYDMGSEYTAEQCRSACELLMNTRSYPKGCWIHDPMHCYCRRGDIVLGYNGGSCTAH
jgi:hypothetical protein